MSKGATKSQTKKKKTTRRMGRPTIEQSQALDEKIKAVALNLFLDRGFEAVTMEEIAEASDITKRTLYMRYKDKNALFSAALHKAKDEWSFIYDDSAISATASLDKKLLALGEALLERSLSPRIVKLSRIATAQAGSFPNEVKSGYSMSLSPRIKTIVEVLAAHQDEIEGSYRRDMEMTAELFLGLITGIPIRLAGMGTLREPAFEKKRVRLAVKLFLEGIRKK